MINGKQSVCSKGRLTILSSLYNIECKIKIRRMIWKIIKNYWQTDFQAL